MSELTFKPAANGDGFMFRTAGWPPQFAKVHLGPVRCGAIGDGISLDLCDCEEPNRCQWHPGGVISFADLEALYFAAKQARAGKETKHGE